MNSIRAILRKAYAALPHVVMASLRPFVRSSPGLESAFLKRLAVPYEYAVYAMGVEHWEQKVLRLGLVNHDAVLDLGCGSGQWLPVLAQHNRAVVGVDLESRLLKIARESVACAPNITLAQMRAEAVPFQSRSFDAVLCYSVLMYTDHDQVISEIKRVLAADGRLVLGLVGMGYYLKHIVEGVKCRDISAVRYGLEPIVLRLAQMALKRRSQGVTYWTARRIRKVLRSHGFDVVRLFPERKERSWPDSYLGSHFYFCVEARKVAEASQ